ERPQGFGQSLKLAGGPRLRRVQPPLARRAPFARRLFVINLPAGQPSVKATPAAHDWCEQRLPRRAGRGFVGVGDEVAAVKARQRLAPDLFRSGVGRLVFAQLDAPDDAAILFEAGELID